MNLNKSNDGYDSLEVSEEKKMHSKCKKRVAVNPIISENAFSFIWELGKYLSNAYLVLDQGLQIDSIFCASWWLLSVAVRVHEPTCGLSREVS